MAQRIVIGDVTIGIQGQDYSYIFSTVAGGMESLCTDHQDRLSGVHKQIMTRDVDLDSKVQSGLQLTALYDAVK